jgi:hypothetical protein
MFFFFVNKEKEPKRKTFYMPCGPVLAARYFGDLI